MFTFTNCKKALLIYPFLILLTFSLTFFALSAEATTNKPYPADGGGPGPAGIQSISIFNVVLNQTPNGLSATLDFTTAFATAASANTPVNGTVSVYLIGGSTTTYTTSCTILSGATSCSHRASLSNLNPLTSWAYHIHAVRTDTSEIADYPGTATLYWEWSPTFSAPAAGATLPATVGSPFSVAFQANDDDSGDSSVTLSVVSSPYPPWLTPFTAPPVTDPVSYTFTSLAGRPNAGDIGSYTLRVRAKDTNGSGGPWVERQITISVTANQPPTATPQSVTTAEDVPRAITLAGTDPEGSPLTYSNVTNPSNGTLTGTAPNVTYTPNLNYNGADSFTFRVYDGQAYSANATVSITVTAVNDAPTATPQGVSTPMNTPKVITLTGADVEGSALTYSIDTNPLHGTLALAFPNVTYTPTALYTGPDSFTFKVYDGALWSTPATVTITVNPNQPPTATPQSVTTAEDVPRAITLAGTDPEGSPLTYSIVTNPSNGTLTGTAPNVTYNPGSNYYGPDSFTFKVNDGVQDSTPATVSITVTAVNDAPTATPQAVSTPMNTSITILLTGSDVDGNPLIFSTIPGSGPSHGSLGAISQGSPTSAQVTYTPTAGYTGSDSFQFRVYDGSVYSSSAATVSITVLADPLRRITTHSADQRFPAISGDKIVWVDWRNGNADIYLYDLSTNTERAITTNPAEQRYPDISGDKIVWDDYRNGNTDIYLYDLSTNTERRITTDPAEQFMPSISGDKIVWIDGRNGTEDTYLYDLSNNTERQITTDRGNDYVYGISGDKIIGERNADIYLYDLSNNTERVITTHPAHQWEPDISVDKIVWVDDRNGNADIYLYDLSTNTERQITTDPAGQWAPAISGDKIVWWDYRNGNIRDIYLYDLSTNTERQITTDPSSQDYPDISGNKIVFEDWRNGNWDIYLYDLSTN